MIKISDLNKAYKAVEEENYRFRIYLKQHADPDELDQHFKDLHKKIYMAYDCSSCRNCCIVYSGNFSHDEINPAAKYLRMSSKEFMDMYIDDNNGLNVKALPCSFLQEDGSCRLNGCKPRSCKNYPFLNKPDRISSLLSLVKSTEDCPIVYEAFEELKRIYRYNKYK